MKKTILLAICVAVSASLKAQIGIGTSSPTSMLDVRGSLSAPGRSFSTATSISTTDYALNFSGSTATAATLPDATGCSGRMYVIKNGSATSPTPVLTVNTTASQTIDGQSSWILDEPNEVICLASNGTNWIVYQQTTPSAKSSTTGGAWNEGGNTLQSAKGIGTKSNFDLPVITNNTERLRVTTGGYIGIGTATPQSRLELSSGTSGLSGLRFSNMNSSSSVTPSVALLGLDTAGKVVVAASSFQARVNYVIVKSASDFPAPSGGVITLASNSVYEVNGTVVLSSKIDLNGSTIRGLVFPLSPLI